MTVEQYAVVAGVTDAVLGLSLGLGFGHRQTPIRIAVLVLSFVMAFFCLSGLFVAYEVLYGRGAVAGLGAALLVSPVNLGLSAGSLVFCLTGTILRRGIARLSSIWSRERM